MYKQQTLGVSLDGMLAACTTGSGPELCSHSTAQCMPASPLVLSFNCLELLEVDVMVYCCCWALSVVSQGGNGSSAARQVRLNGQQYSWHHVWQPMTVCICTLVSFGLSFLHKSCLPVAAGYMIRFHAVQLHAMCSAMAACGS